MNKLVYIPILILLAMTLTGCHFFDSQTDLPIEMVAFNSLTEEEKDFIPVSPKDSIVKKITIDHENKPLIEKDYNKNEVYSVTFLNTESDAMGNLTVFVDINKKTVVGKGFTSK